MGFSLSKRLANSKVTSRTALAVTVGAVRELAGVEGIKQPTLLECDRQTASVLILVGQLRKALTRQV